MKLLGELNLNAFHPAFAQFQGYLAIDETALPALLAEVERITPDQIAARTELVKASNAEQMSYQVQDGIATVHLNGVMSKGGSSLSGAGSTVAARMALRKAERDDRVKGVLFVVETPGGTIAGTGELGQDVARIAASKPLYVAGVDLVASAGYWAVSGATRIFLNEFGRAGSIGAYTEVTDSSAAFEKAGNKKIVVKSAKYKGIGTEGVAVTDEQLAVVQNRIDEAGEMFVQVVANGRRRTVADVRQWATGDTFSAAESLRLGLIDEIGSVEEAWAALAQAIQSSDSARSGGSASQTGVSEMTLKEIMAACEGIDPKADAAWLIEIQGQDGLTELGVAKAWGKEQKRRADEAKATADKAAKDLADAQAKSKADESRADADEKLRQELTPGGNKAPGDGDGSTGGSAASPRQHPFMVAAQELADADGLTIGEAMAAVARDNRDLYMGFMRSVPANRGVDTLTARDATRFA